MFNQNALLGESADLLLIMDSGFAQPQRVGHHVNRTEGHCHLCYNRVQQAENGNGNCDEVIEGSPKEILWANILLILV